MAQLYRGVRGRFTRAARLSYSLDYDSRWHHFTVVCAMATLLIQSSYAHEHAHPWRHFTVVCYQDNSPKIISETGLLIMIINIHKDTDHLYEYP